MQTPQQQTDTAIRLIRLAFRDGGQITFDDVMLWTLTLRRAIEEDWPIKGWPLFNRLVSRAHSEVKR